MTVEQLLRDALAEKAAPIPRPADRWADVEAAAARARRRTPAARARSRRVGGFTAVVVATAAAAALIAIPAISHDTSQHTVSVQPASGSSSTVAPQTTTRPTAPTLPPASALPHPSPPPASGALPLYPFANPDQVNAWLASYQATGAQPWHLDPGQTALSFAGFLGYNGIDKVISVHADANGDHVAIGYALPNGGTSTAAVVHLRRFGGGSDDPWEVVGTDDTPAFSVTSPGYGAVAASPLAVGGADTEVDPNVRVEVLQLSSPKPLATVCCWPGNRTTPKLGQWSLPVSYRGAVDPVLVVSASNAGGLEAVGQFAVTGVRTTPGVTPGL